jgi:hypothetical protein
MNLSLYTWYKLIKDKLVKTDTNRDRGKEQDSRPNWHLTPKKTLHKNTDKEQVITH